MTEINGVESLNGVWYSLSLTLVPGRHNAHRPRNPLSTGEALVKEISRLASMPVSASILFNWSRPRLTPERPVDLNIDLFGVGAEQVETWFHHALSHLSPGGGVRNFHLLSHQPPQITRLDDAPVVSEHTEVCLYFSTPLPLKPKAGKPRHWLSGQEFSDLLTARWRRIFDTKPDLPAEPLRVLPYYWHYQQTVHRSASQNRHPQYLNGCQGPLYLRARDTAHMRQWWPWLYAAARLGMGWRVSFGLGRCRLQSSTPYFSSELFQPRHVARAVDKVVERHDDLRIALAGFTLESQADAEGIARHVVEYMRGGEEPTPYTAMDIPKKEGGVRQIEKPEARDSGGADASESVAGAGNGKRI